VQERLMVELLELLVLCMTPALYLPCCPECAVCRVADCLVMERLMVELLELLVLCITPATVFTVLP
jgi:hypothetical protein